MVICTRPECQTTAGCQCNRQPFAHGVAAAWVCPKCGRVYGPQVPGCFACNAAVDTKQAVSTTGTNIR